MVQVLWDDAVTPASNWSISDNETLLDDVNDKPDGVHQSMDIIIGNENYFDDTLSIPNFIDGSAYTHVSLWWKGANTGQTIYLYFFSFASLGQQAPSALISWIDNSTSWTHLTFSKSAFTISGGFNWSEITGIEIWNDNYEGLTQGTTFKIAYVICDPAGQQPVSDSLGTVESAVSAGTALLNFSVPWRPREKTLYTGNYVVAKVEGQKLVLSAEELRQYLDDGYDVEILGYPRE